MDVRHDQGMRRAPGPDGERMCSALLQVVGYPSSPDFSRPNSASQTQSLDPLFPVLHPTTLPSRDTTRTTTTTITAAVSHVPSPASSFTSSTVFSSRVHRENPHTNGSTSNALPFPYHNTNVGSRIEHPPGLRGGIPSTPSPVEEMERRAPSVDNSAVTLPGVTKRVPSHPPRPTAPSRSLAVGSVLSFLKGKKYTLPSSRHATGMRRGSMEGTGDSGIQQHVSEGTSSVYGTRPASRVPRQDPSLPLSNEESASQWAQEWCLVGERMRYRRS